MTELPALDDIADALAAPVAARVIREWRQVRLLEGPDPIEPMVVADELAERVLIGALLDGQLLATDLLDLQPGDFNHPFCRSIFHLWSGAQLRGLCLDDARMADALVAAGYARDAEAVRRLLVLLRASLPVLTEPPARLVERVRSLGRLRRFFRQVRELEVRACLAARESGAPAFACEGHSALDPDLVLAQLTSALEAASRP